MKIIRNGFSSRNRNIGLVSLPKNLKKAWPDRNNYSPVSCYDNDNIARKLREYNIKEHERILDIGAFQNEMVERLQDEGFHNAVGIDVNSRILKSRYGRQINFRDLPLNEKYRVIYFNQLLEHFPGGIHNNQTEPSLQILANKIYIHLLPKGYLIYCDSEENAPEFHKCLQNIGLKHILEKDKYFHIFQKG